MSRCAYNNCPAYPMHGEEYCRDHYKMCDDDECEIRVRKGVANCPDHRLYRGGKRLTEAEQNDIIVSKLVRVRYDYIERGWTADAERVTKQIERLRND